MNYLNGGLVCLLVSCSMQAMFYDSTRGTSQQQVQRRQLETAWIKAEHELQIAKREHELCQEESFNLVSALPSDCMFESLTLFHEHHNALLRSKHKAVKQAQRVVNYYKCQLQEDPKSSPTFHE